MNKHSCTHFLIQCSFSLSLFLSPSSFPSLPLSVKKSAKWLQTSRIRFYCWSGPFTVHGLVKLSEPLSLFFVLRWELLQHSVVDGSGKIPVRISKIDSLLN